MLAKPRPMSTVRGEPVELRSRRWIDRSCPCCITVRRVVRQPHHERESGDGISRQDASRHGLRFSRAYRRRCRRHPREIPQHRASPHVAARFGALPMLASSRPGI